MASPVVVELAHIRCPDLPAGTAEAFAIRIARPRPDLKDEAGQSWVSASALQKGIDDRDAAMARMGKTGETVISAYERCRADRSAT